MLVSRLINVKYIGRADVVLSKRDMVHKGLIPLHRLTLLAILLHHKSRRIEAFRWFSRNRRLKKQLLKTYERTLDKDAHEEGDYVSQQIVTKEEMQRIVMRGMDALLEGSRVVPDHERVHQVGHIRQSAKWQETSP